MTVPKQTTASKIVSKSLNKVEGTLSRSVVFVVIIIATAVLFAGNLFLTGLAGNPEMSRGLFIRGISEVSREFPLNITPAGFTFAIWGVIYFLQIGWILYSLGLICRTTEDGPAYLNPIILSPAYFLYFNASTLAVTAWLFMWDRLLFIAAFVFLALVVTSLVMTVTAGASSLARHRSELIDQGRGLDVKILTVFMVNGVSMYATWTSIATLINLATLLVYRLISPFTNETASILCLSILACLLVLYTVLDSTVLKPYNRYNFAPYATVIWALIGVLAKNLDLANISSIISIALLVGTSAVFLAKLVNAVLRFVSLEQYEYKQMRFGRVVTPIPEKKEIGL
ncbi:hypothetical protein ElyMa_002926500 [Elysia marginata]|uniref:Uncharacterized protein n=1 Tax=Elysia marginata TaxID=1093978 RepID=A0AAV4I436_9GAST|nr:hypothetical protein ElyMa_002926500 [Elysia marginata]